MLDFPDSPVDGQTHTEEGQIWRWNEAAGVWSVGNRPGASSETQIVDSLITGSTGWQVWGDLLIQFGAVTGNATGPTPATFPTPFKDGIIPRVTLSANSTSPDNRHYSHRDVTHLGFDLYMKNSSAVWVSTQCHYIAVGEAPDDMKKPKSVLDTTGSAAAGIFQIVDDGPQHVIIGNTLIQWGIGDVSGESGGINVVYPQPFKSEPRVVATPGFVNLSNDTNSRSVSVVNVTATSFDARQALYSAQNPVTQQIDTTLFHWVAIGEAPDDMAMPTEIEVLGVDAKDYMLKTDIEADYLNKTTLDGQTVTGTVNFDKIVGVGEDVYMTREAGKNESGVFFHRDEGPGLGAAYLFWDQAGDQLVVNTYGSDGVWTGAPLRIPTTDTDAITISRNLYIDRSAAAIYIDGQGGNTHLYYRHSFVNHALIYSPPATNVGQLNVNHYNNSGGFIGSTLLYSFQGGGRVETGDMVVTAGGGRYYGPRNNYGCAIQNDFGGPVAYGDLGYHGLVGGGGGPTGVYMHVGNNNDVTTWGIFCDFVSDMSTKEAVQASQTDALRDISALNPIRWRYNEKAPRIGKLVPREKPQRAAATEFNTEPTDTTVVDEYITPEPSDDDIVELGFSSEDIKRIAPGAVYEIDGIERIDYRQVVPHCLRAIQQLMKRVEELENKP